MPFSTQTVDSDSDWETYAKFHNEIFDAAQITGEQARIFAGQVPSTARSWRFLLLDSTTPCGSGAVIEAFWYDQPGRFEQRIFPGLGEGKVQRFEELVRVQTEWVVRSGGKSLGTWVKSVFPQFLDVLLSLGYKTGQTNEELGLNVLQFDASRHGSHHRDSKISVNSILELSASVPDWKERFWKLEEAVMHDVPLPEAYRGRTYEDFCKNFDDPTLRLDSSFVALDGDEWIGLSQLLPNIVDPAKATTGLTGVLAPYRRSGIATRLKVKALTWAKKSGICTVYTDTEEANPMKDLNMRLGFKTLYQWIECARPLA